MPVFIAVAFAAAVLSAVIAYVLIPLLWVTHARVRLRSDAGECKNLVLTFDDGPGNRLTPMLLDLFRETGAKATFFLLGRNITGREELVRRIAADGHEIGSHGYDHLDYGKTGPWRTVTDIRRGWQAIDGALGRRGGAYPFRPPYGRLNLAGLIYLWRRHVPVVYWTFDSGDTWAPGPREAQRARLPGDVPEGAVVLVHDFDRTRPDVDRAVLAVVKGLLGRAGARGIPVVKVSEFLMNCRKPPHESGTAFVARVDDDGCGP